MNANYIKQRVNFKKVIKSLKGNNMTTIMFWLYLKVIYFIQDYSKGNIGNTS